MLNKLHTTLEQSCAYFSRLVNRLQSSSHNHSLCYRKQLMLRPEAEQKRHLLFKIGGWVWAVLFFSIVRLISVQNLCKTQLTTPGVSNLKGCMHLLIHSLHQNFWLKTGFYNFGTGIKCTQLFVTGLNAASQHDLTHAQEQSTLAKVD